MTIVHFFKTGRFSGSAVLSLQYYFPLLLDLLVGLRHPGNILLDHHAEGSVRIPYIQAIKVSSGTALPYPSFMVLGEQGCKFHKLPNLHIQVSSMSGFANLKDVLSQSILKMTG